MSAEDRTVREAESSSGRPHPPGRDRGSLLVLQNPGRFTRHYLADMAAAANRLGIPTVVLELGTVWDARQQGTPMPSDQMHEILQQHRVRAVIGSGSNGLLEWPMEGLPDGTLRPFFERAAIPHLMWWTDHPQWANERFGLRPELQPALCSPNIHTFVKSPVAARELKDILGWPHCIGLPVAENPDRLKPVAIAKPDFDVVAVVGSPPDSDTSLERFLADDDPDIEAISATVAPGVLSRILDRWAIHAPRNFHLSLELFARDWVRARAREPLVGSYRLFTRLAFRHRKAREWIRANPHAYFDAVESLWAFGRWQRTFYLRYLAKYFRVGVFGCDWTAVGIAGSKEWVAHEDQPTVYARGRVAINLSQAGDEEGLAHKPFQIAASGVPMVHIARRGLADCFTPGTEVLAFLTPREARDAVGLLLSDRVRAKRMAGAARERLCREHTWEQRLPQLLAAAGVTSIA